MSESLPPPRPAETGADGPRPTPAGAVPAEPPESATAAPDGEAAPGVTRQPEAVDSVAGLVAAREARGLSAADVVAALKLSSRQVAALEAGDWASLPGLAFTRAALRSYGRLIGVSVEPLAAAIGQGVAAPELREAASLRAPLPRTGVLGFGAGGSGSRLAWIALAIALLVVVGLFFGREAAREQDPPSRPASPAAPASPAVPAPTSAPASPAVPALTSAPAGSTAPAAAVSPMPSPMAAAAPAAQAPVPASAAAAPVPAAATPAAEKAALAPGVSSAPGAGSTGAAPAPAAFPMLAPSAREALLRFEREAWIEVRRADGQLVVEGLQRAGTEVRLPLSGELSLVLGNAEFVRVERGGTPVDLKPLIRQGVARLKLAP